MNIVADRYQFRARIIPEFLVVLPILILLISYVGSLLIFGFLSVALFFVFFQGHLSSRLGRKLEEKLRTKKELPLNSDYIIELFETDAEHEYISLLKNAAEKSEIGSPFPIHDKVENALKIDKIILWLIEHTRDTEKFPAVFDKLCDYGFCRNTLALRKWALSVTFLAFLLFLFPSMTIDFQRFVELEFTYDHLDDETLNIGSIWFFLTIFWIVFWTRIVSLNALKKASENYLTTLLRASSSVERENKTTSQNLNL